MVSAPGPPTSRHSPPLAVIESFPAPPVMQSDPPPPVIVQGTETPTALIVSFPAPPPDEQTTEIPGALVFPVTASGQWVRTAKGVPPCETPDIPFPAANPAV